MFPMRRLCLFFLLHMPPSGVGGRALGVFGFCSLVHMYPPVLSFSLLEIHYHLFQTCAGLGSDSLFSVAFANGRLHLLGGDVLGSVNGSGFRAMSTQDMFICSHWSRGRYFDRLRKRRTNSYGRNLHTLGLCYCQFMLFYTCRSLLPAVEPAW